MFHRRRSGDNDEENGSICKEEKVKELKVAIGPITSSYHLKYCTDACMRRYLEARNWNVEKSRKMLEESLKWRSAYKPEQIRWHQVEKEGETGKIYRANFCDREGRTVLVMKPGRENTTSHDGQILYLVYLLENAILNLPEGQEQMAWLVDFTGWSLRKVTPIKTARETANILQSHYPERLSYGILYNPPKIFETFWKVVKYFLDPKTYQKVKFVYPKNKESIELMENNFDHEVLPIEFGGKCNWEYDHEQVSHVMAKDDIRLEAIWGTTDDRSNQINGHSSSHIELSS